MGCSVISYGSTFRPRVDSDGQKQQVQGCYGYSGYESLLKNCKKLQINKTGVYTFRQKFNFKHNSKKIFSRKKYVHVNLELII